MGVSDLLVENVTTSTKSFCSIHSNFRMKYHVIETNDMI